MSNEKFPHSCIDCAVTNCNSDNDIFPDFCPTAELLRARDAAAGADSGTHPGKNMKQTAVCGTQAAAETSSGSSACGTARAEKSQPYAADAGNTQPEDESCHSCDMIDDVLSLYIEDEENSKVMQAAAMVEYENYCKMTRLEEIAEFARKIGAVKLGIATCVGLIAESRAAAQFYRHKGFDVYGIACKVGAQPKTKVGIDPCCQAVGKNICNPIMQARLLNEKKTDLNIVVGLCVGHDSLFYKYSDALCTTLVTKDRVLGHNPAAALYQMKSYYSKLLK